MSRRRGRGSRVPGIKARSAEARPRRARTLDPAPWAVAQAWAIDALAARALARQTVARARASLMHGCATSLPEGVHWHRNPAGAGASVAATEEIHRCVTVLGALQELDASTVVAPDPWVADDRAVVAAVAAADGRAVGYLLLSDRDGDGNPEALGNIWTAPGLRRRGVATALLERARAEHALRHAEPPILDDGRRLLEAVAPDLLPGRGSTRGRTNLKAQGSKP